MRISTPNQVGAIVKRGRTACGLTQTELAEQAGVSRRLVNDLESGRARNVGLERLVAILDALELPLVIGDAPTSEETPEHLRAFEDDMAAAGNAALALFKDAGTRHAR